MTIETDDRSNRQATLLQTYLAEITRSSDEHLSDVGSRVVVRMSRCNAVDNTRFLCLRTVI